MEYQNIEVKVGGFDTSAEYAPVYDEQIKSTENESKISNDEIFENPYSDSGTDASEDEAGADGKTPRDASKNASPTKDSLPPKVDGVKQSDENVYDLPDNALPESETSSQTSRTSSAKKKSNHSGEWLCTARNMIALLFSVALLSTGIFLAVYLPMTLKTDKGWSENYALLEYYLEI